MEFKDASADSQETLIELYKLWGLTQIKDNIADYFEAELLKNEHVAIIKAGILASLAKLKRHMVAL